MTVTLSDWQKYQEARPNKGGGPRITNEQRSEAIRAQQALDHPGFSLLQSELCQWKDKMAGESKAAEHRLCHGRGIGEEEIHRLREDIANFSGFLKAIDIALEILPNAVKVVRDGA